MKNETPFACFFANSRPRAPEPHRPPPQHGETGRLFERQQQSDKRRGSGSAEPGVVTAARMAESARDDDVEELREQDRFLPIANINRIVKRRLPYNAKVAKEAKETTQVRKLRLPLKTAEHRRGPSLPIRLFPSAFSCAQEESRSNCVSGLVGKSPAEQTFPVASPEVFTIHFYDTPSARLRRTDRSTTEASPKHPPNCTGKELSRWFLPWASCCLARSAGGTLAHAA